MNNHYYLLAFMWCLALNIRNPRRVESVQHSMARKQRQYVSSLRTDMCKTKVGFPKRDEYLYIIKIRNQRPMQLTIALCKL